MFLRGGYDSTNFLIPYSSDFYYESRPNIAIARPDPASATGALALDADWALLPPYGKRSARCTCERQAAFVPFAGTDDLSRSHFETQDSIELGQPLGRRARLPLRLSRPFVADAWRHRAAAHAPPIAFTDALPLAFAGGATVPNLSLKNVGKPPFDERQARILSDMYAGHHLESAVRDGLDLRQEVAQKIAEEMLAADRSAINTKGFELEAERMAQLMRDKYRSGFIDVGGWDTHVGEGAAQGTLAGNLASLGRGLQVFAQTLGAEWNNTVVVVLSEFGRTFRENGNRGTDHGHGTVYWVLGGCRSRGGRVRASSAPSTGPTCSRTAISPCSTTIGRCSAGCSARSGVCPPYNATRCSHRSARSISSSCKEGAPCTPREFSRQPWGRCFARRRRSRATA